MRYDNVRYSSLFCSVEMRICALIAHVNISSVKDYSIPVDRLDGHCIARHYGE